jgi:4-hydroxy-tetrahydrodipicolinate synthase
VRRGESIKAIQRAHRGVIVPMVTPVTVEGTLDERAAGRILDHLMQGGVHGVFLLGTTGEGPFIPKLMRERLVELATERVEGRILLYAGISSDSLGESIAAGNQYLKLGVDAVVAHVPGHFEKHPQEALAFYADLANQLDGGLILYNMPLTTNVSLPIELCKTTACRPRVIGIKDSENDLPRMVELLRQLGDKKDFSVYIGTGPLMARGLLLGAEGVVPSVGNVAPELCRRMYDAAIQGDGAATEKLHLEVMAVSAIYQSGRRLNESIAALKTAMSWLGLCQPYTLPPLAPLSRAEALVMRDKLAAFGFPLIEGDIDGKETSDWANHGRSGRDRAGALPASPSQS